ncbi:MULTISPECIES: GNAT family N-acetyltransferase [Caproicibacterium]|uniref:GNAT family N-acetyltransferase n=1 Tax=Caproicibacterium argilliputei TaxID=3030016 RepID=A0AA97DB77_9FIRM|nr:GNAT family N-acetyltransferase [Caproicibacterium argilliputei]WOC32423.1 GNAT family N-acetyltransferase [Caproicibacterium argilliputei]
MVREARRTDLNGILLLYAQLHSCAQPCTVENAETVWEQILKNPDCHVVVNEVYGRIVSACSMVIVPDIARGQRPYALVENMVTDASFRRQGFGSACLREAKRIAIQNNCYQIVLMAGSKEPGVMHYYEKSGYCRSEKTAFAQSLI